MGKKKLWSDLTPQQIEEFAQGWIRELSDSGKPEGFAESVVWMGFTASAEQQWGFLTAANANSTSQEHYEYIAAGPAECLLSRFGEYCIVWFEEKALSDLVFSKMLLGVNQHRMSESIWLRVQSIQLTARGSCD